MKSRNALVLASLASGVFAMSISSATAGQPGHPTFGHGPTLNSPAPVAPTAPHSNVVTVAPGAPRTAVVPQQPGHPGFFRQNAPTQGNQSAQQPQAPAQNYTGGGGSGAEMQKARQEALKKTYLARKKAFEEDRQRLRVLQLGTDPETAAAMTQREAQEWMAARMARAVSQRAVIEDAIRRGVQPPPADTQLTQTMLVQQNPLPSNRMMPSQEGWRGSGGHSRLRP